MIVRLALFVVLIATQCIVPTLGANSLRHRSRTTDADVGDVDEFSPDGDSDGRVSRRLSISSLMNTRFKVSNDPKTTEAKGYVCNKGEVPWDSREEMLSEIPSFISAYHARKKFFDIDLDLVKKDIITNFGGSGLFHAYTMWVVLRKLRPSVIVESGTYRGFTSWMIARATEEWAPLIVRIDPWAVGWDGVQGNPNSHRMVDLRGDRHQDITRINWDELFQANGLTEADKGNTLFILDDYADQLLRIGQIHGMGFQHVLVDENFVPAMGTAFSLKDACDYEGNLRRAFTRGTHSEVVPRRCTNSRKDCTDLTLEEGQRAFQEFDHLIETYWEGPPLAPLDRPYSSVIKKLENKYIDGPSEWTIHHARLVHQSSKNPIYGNLEEASKSTGLSEMHLSYESGRYTNMAYIKLGPAAVQNRRLTESSPNNTRRLLGVSIVPKEVEHTLTKGYVCNKGTVQWDTQVQILSELKSFIEAHQQRNVFFKIDLNKQSTNYGGFGMFHSFIIWVVLRKTKPTVIVESGVDGGYTSWLMAKATEEWAPLFVRLDPNKLGWDGKNRNPNEAKMINLRGEQFQDITEVDWDMLFSNHGLTAADKASTLFVLDDHQDQVERLAQVRSLGFLYAILNNNFVPGVGDAFSLKDACDANGDLRRNFNKSVIRSVPIQPSRCTNAHQECVKLDPFQSQIVAMDLDSMVKTYWEGPPLAPIVRPYQSLVPHLQDKDKFEGPPIWTENHARLVAESSKAPFYESMQLASTVTGYSKEVLSFESSRYLNIVYIELNPLEPLDTLQ